MPEKYKAIDATLSEYVITGAIIFLILALLFVLFMVFSVQRRRKMLLEKKQIELQFSQTLLQSQLEIQEQTLKNISQEIHDNIGQALTLAKLNLNTLGAELDEAPMQKISNSKEIISKAINDLRDIGRSLNTDYIADMGLHKALEFEFNLISRSSTIQTKLQAAGEPFRMDQQKELILFRIIQEALNNSIKHASAKNINARIVYSNDKLELSIADDGKGFEATETPKDNGSGLGLRNMQNRAKLIGAELNINSSPGNGTVIKILLPNQPENKKENQ
jgi:signal transduction histidine kinase